MERWSPLHRCVMLVDKHDSSETGRITVEALTFLTEVILLCSERRLSVPRRPVIPCDGVAPHTPSRTQTGSYQPAGTDSPRCHRVVPPLMTGCHHSVLYRTVTSWQPWNWQSDLGRPWSSKRWMEWNLCSIHCWGGSSSHKVGLSEWNILKMTLSATSSYFISESWQTVHHSDQSVVVLLF